jgi:phosphopantothenoylcysteine decarboxylase/phosphopantothenate--cysteine ligase
MSVLRDSRVVLGVSAGIAAYKAADLTSKLVQAGAVVDVVMTEAATRLVGPTTFQALTKRPVHVDPFAPWSENWFGHISLGHEANAIVVAPATANTIAGLAHGFAGDMLGAVALSSRAPLIIAPAMEELMYRHPATQSNLTQLVERGALQVGPFLGRLASGEIGEGRLAPPETIVSAIRYALGRNGPLAGTRVVVTAGGTREPLDPVRYLGNRSSGLMGMAIAEAAIDAGATVTLITTNPGADEPFGATAVPVETAEQMRDAVERAVAHADVLFMAAAVADFRASAPSAAKIKKRPGQESITIELARNPDILASIDRPGLIKIGFAAETEDLLESARQKLRDKRLDMIVANDAESTIGSPESAPHFLFADGRSMALPRAAKADIAAELIAHLSRLLGARHD